MTSDTRQSILILSKSQYKIPKIQKIAENIKRIKNVLTIKIHIPTRRFLPEKKSIQDSSIRRVGVAEWSTASCLLHGRSWV